MENQRAIELLNAYRRGCEFSFSELYEAHKPMILSVAKSAVKGTPFPLAEMVSELNEEFWRVTSDFDETKSAPFRGVVKYRLRRKSKELFRGKHGTYYDKVKFFEEGEPDAATSETPESVFFDVAESDQRQLIGFLSKTADAPTKRIVEASLKNRHKSITALGKALGLHHSVVKRKIERLSRNYDPSQFGDYHDYLAV